MTAPIPSRMIPATTTVVAAEMTRDVQPQVAAMAAALAAQYPGATQAVLFYGSCLREDQLDGLMLDFYVIVSDYQAAYDRRWLATANRLIPPNVFPFERDGLIAKYAVLSIDDFRRLCSVQAGDVSVWARFAQPTRIVWALDTATQHDVIAAASQSTPTLVHYALPMMEPENADDLAVWRRGFALTYGAELRAERGDRSGSIVDFDPDHYRRLTAALRQDQALQSPLSPQQADKAWRRFRRRGKMLTLARLSKASLTFAGGIDYLAWKIQRHAKTTIVIQPWQRRWPIVAALLMLPRLIRSGAIR